MINQYFVLGIVFFAAFIGALVLIPLFSAHSSYLATLNNSSYDEKQILIRKRNIQAGFSLGICIFALIVAAGWCMDFSWYIYLPVALLLCAAVYRLPAIINKKIAVKGLRDFDDGMLDFTVLILNSLKAGLSLTGAIEAALENTSGPIYDEFSLMLKEHRLGLELPIAINNMTQRNDSENLQLFALTISVCMKTGGSMVDVLEHVVATIRQRGEFQDKVKTMVAQSKFEALAISLSPLAALLILYAVKPDFVYPMLVHPIGWCAMAFVCFWEIIGFIIIKRVVTVKF